MIWATINLVFFAALLVFLLKEKVREYVHERHVIMRENVIGVREKLRDARERMEEFSAKLEAVDTEVKSLTRQAGDDGESVKIKLLNSAKEKSGTLIEEVRQRSTELVGDLKSELVSDMANLVVSRAEESLSGKLTGADKKRFHKEFTSSLNGRTRVRGEA